LPKVFRIQNTFVVCA